MKRPKSKSRRFENPNDPSPSEPTAARRAKVRIVAGQMGGRLVRYNGDLMTRPMKDRTRESLFSRLGGYLYNTVAVDLFAGTGVLGIEAVSRGAEHAILLELSRTTVATINDTLADLKIVDRATVRCMDSFAWVADIDRNLHAWKNKPWIVFCCPPFEMWTTMPEKLNEMLAKVIQHAPPGSQIAVEMDEKFDPEGLPPAEWDTRLYRPAWVSVLRFPEPEEATEAPAAETPADPVSD